MKKTLKEYQVDDDLKKAQLTQRVKDKLKFEGFYEEDESNLEDFVNDKYDLLITDIDSIDGKILLNNYKDFLQSESSISEAFIRKIIKEGKPS